MPSPSTQFLVFSKNPESTSLLAALLAGQGRVVAADLRYEPSDPLPGSTAPRLIFIDFNVDLVTDAGRADLDAARRLCAFAAQRFPQIPRIALTRYDAGTLTVEALRAGASDCIDLGNDRDAARTLTRLMQAPLPAAAPAASRGRSILILGARQGMGATTLATHLAALARQRLRAAIAAHHRKNPQDAYREPSHQETAVCLLDLGVPTRDGLLYSGVAQGFDFLDAARSLHRLDETLLDSALPHDQQGMGILSLPSRLEDMRHVTHMEALALFNRLHDFFSMLVVDTGGMENIGFVAGLAKAADQIWIITDQSLGGLLSLAEYLDRLKAQELAANQLRLVVNRHSSQYGLSAQQIASKFNIPLLGTIPDCTLALWKHLNQGEHLLQTAPRHPYLQAVRHLLHDAAIEADTAPSQSRARALWSSLIHPRRFSSSSRGTS